MNALMGEAMRYLKNPYVAAGVIGVGTFMALEFLDLDFLKDIPMASTFNLGLFAAIAYIGYLYYYGKIDLPVLGRRRPSLTFSMPASAPIAASQPAQPVAMKAMSATMNDLLGPDEF